jgi:hypothetical protein
MEPAAVALPSWIGTRAYDCEGARLGHVADVLFDDATHRPDWLLLVLLRAADRFVLVPARGAVRRTAGLALPYERALIRSAPVAAAPPGELGRAHAKALSRHYRARVGDGPWTGIVEPAFAQADDRVRMAG